MFSNLELKFEKRFYKDFHSFKRGGVQVSKLPGSILFLGGKGQNISLPNLSYNLAIILNLKRPSTHFQSKESTIRMLVFFNVTKATI